MSSVLIQGRICFSTENTECTRAIFVHVITDCCPMQK